MDAKASLRVLFFLVSLLIVVGHPGTGKAATPLGIGVWPNIAASGSNIYVVWGGEGGVVLRRSLDGGSNFLPAVSFALNPPFGASSPDVAVSGSNVYLVWADNGVPGGNDIILRRSADGGETFSDPINLSNTPLDPTEDFPRIAVSGSTIHVVWHVGPDRPEIMYSRSIDGGLHFSTPINLSNSPGRQSTFPVVAASGLNVFVAWAEFSGNAEVFLARSVNGGAMFSSPDNISNTPTPSGSPSIAVDGLDGVFIAWGDDYSGAGDVLLRRSTNNGSKFSPILNISRNPEDSGKPSLVVSGQTLFFAWHDFGQPDNPNSLEIRFSRSADGGGTTSPPVNISNSLGVSELPRVAASGGAAYVVWRDQGQIMFLRDLPVPDPAPKIRDVSPSLGPVDATLTLTGLNFGATRGPTSNVFVGRQLASVLTWSDTQVQVNVPSLSPGTYQIVLFKDAVLYSNPGTFQVIAPLSISGTVKINGNLAPGTVVKLTGTASATTTTNAGTYTFGNLAPGTYTITPSDPSFSFNPSERTVGLVAKSLTGVDFAGATSTAPVLTDRFPVAGRRGNLVTITGSSFGMQQGMAQVLFGGIPADEIKYWTDTTIAAYVPQSLSIGPTSIWVKNAAGQPSQSRPFTVNDIPNPVILVRGLHFPFPDVVNPICGDPTDTSDWNDWKNLLRGLSPYSGSFMVTVPGDASFNSADRIDGSDRVFNNARRLEGHISSVQARFEGANGYKPKVDLIGHSMGGLIIREYLDFESVKLSPPVDKVIMIGTPNKGAPKANVLLAAPPCGLRPALENLTTTFVQNVFNPAHPNNSLVDSFLIAGLIFDLDIAPNPVNRSSRVLCTSTDVFKTLGRCDDSIVPWVSVLDYDPLRPPKGKYSFAIRHDKLNNDFNVLQDPVFHILSNNPPPSTASSLGAEPASIPQFSASLASSLNVASVLSSESSSLQAIEVDGQPGLSGAPTRTISQGQKQTLTLPVENTPQATFLLAWGEPVSDLDFVLVAPDGTRIDPNFAAANPDTVQFSTVPAGENLLLEKFYVVQHPLPGVWMLEVTGRAVSSPQMGFLATAIPEGGVVLAVGPLKGEYDPSEQALLSAQLTESGIFPVAGASVQAMVSRPDGGTDTVTLFDDGLHGDGSANDGLYGNNYLLSSGLTGSYILAFSASGNNAVGELFSRGAQATAQVVLPPDTTPPSSAIIFPTSSLLIGGTTLTITGGASDNVAVSGVQVSTDGGNTWSAASCTGCPGANITWNYYWTLPPTGSYTLKSRATDSSSNVEVPGTGVVVYVDRNAPASSITAPASNSFINLGSPNPYAVTGTASDTGGGVVSKVEVSADGGSTWNTGINTGTNFSTWSYTWNLPSDGVYTLKSRATDSATNTANVENPGAGITVIVDRTRPDTSITGGPSGTITTNSATLTWTGSDNLTPAGSLMYAFRLDPLETKFSAFGSATSRTYSWTSSCSANGTYTLYVKARDQAGNEDLTPASRSFTVPKDITTLVLRPCIAPM